MTEAEKCLIPSQDVCRAMPVEPDAWYGIRTYDEGAYEWLVMGKGRSLEKLHNVIDGVRGSTFHLMWIQRLTTQEAKVLGL